ncbi:MAG: Asp-tRNA(Asn)/Glu-tRNA(Gln) amidotransferase subunit GatB, partial [Chloroflexota bacterium]|nr:Asp-tRNA(Asn)/Glu-tRNA(Gln) amidotransferase subunit GatB [Chloroflexota bacterium]
QISQYKRPIAQNGRLKIRVEDGEKVIRVRRAHLEEDAGKLTHVCTEASSHSLVDLNRAGVPLLEIVSEPDMHSAEEARAYAEALRSIIRYLGVNSGNMQEGVLRFEANISVRPVGEQKLGTRTEIKNLNSFRALERSIDYEIQRQSDLLRQGKSVIQETRGWDESREVTVSQRSKEEADDYRYFPEPDLPPLVIEAEWVAELRSSLPELPDSKYQRFREQYGLNEYDAGVLVADRDVAAYFEAVVDAAASAAADVDPKLVVNWVTGKLFGLANQAGLNFTSLELSPSNLAGLLNLLADKTINNNTAKTVLAEMFASGKSAQDIVDERGLRQISDSGQISATIARVLDENPDQLGTYLGGKEGLINWFFGQVMRITKGKANPQVVRAELQSQLAKKKGQ